MINSNIGEIYNTEMQWSSLNLKVCVGVVDNQNNTGKIVNVKNHYSSSGCSSCSQTYTIALPNSNQTVGEFTRDLVESYIPRTWLMNVIKKAKYRKQWVILDYGFGCHSCIFSKNQKANQSDKDIHPNKIRSFDALSAKLKLGQSESDSVFLSSDDFICDYIDQWDISKTASSSSEEELFSEQMYLWLDFKCKDAANISQCKSEDMNTERKPIYIFEQDNEHKPMKKKRTMDMSVCSTKTELKNTPQKRKVGSYNEDDGIMRNGVCSKDKSSKKREGLNIPSFDTTPQLKKDKNNINFNSNNYDGGKIESIKKNVTNSIITTSKTKQVYYRRKRSDPPLMHNKNEATRPQISQ